MNYLQVNAAATSAAGEYSQGHRKWVKSRLEDTDGLEMVMRSRTH